MVNPHEIPGALEELQESIWRERILHARQISRLKHFDAAFTLSNETAGSFLDGVRSQTGLVGGSELQHEARRRIRRLARVRDYQYLIHDPEK